MTRASAAAVAGVFTILLGSVALAQSTETPSPPSASPPASVPPTDQANAQASTATATANTKLAAIRERARATSTQSVKTTEQKLEATKSSVDQEASAAGENVVADRLANEFGMTADALIAERAQFSTGWGDLMIAHALLANATTEITIVELFQMRTEDDLGWGQIARGMNLRLGDVVSAAASEGRVAAGLAKADGKVATIRSGSAPKARSTASSKTAATSHSGAGAGAAAIRGPSTK